MKPIIRELQEKLDTMSLQEILNFSEIVQVEIINKSALRKNITSKRNVDKNALWKVNSDLINLQKIAQKIALKRRILRDDMNEELLYWKAISKLLTTKCTDEDVEEVVKIVTSKSKTGKQYKF